MACYMILTIKSGVRSGHCAVPSLICLKTCACSYLLTLVDNTKDELMKELPRIA